MDSGSKNNCACRCVLRESMQGRRLRLDRGQYLARPWPCEVHVFQTEFAYSPGVGSAAGGETSRQRIKVAISGTVLATMSTG